MTAQAHLTATKNQTKLAPRACNPLLPFKTLRQRWVEEKERASDQGGALPNSPDRNGPKRRKGPENVAPLDV